MGFLQVFSFHSLKPWMFRLITDSKVPLDVSLRENVCVSVCAIEEDDKLTDKGDE